MAEIPNYPKILQLGDKHIRTIFDEPTEITEKIDGSQFCFGKIEGELVVRSKGKIMPVDAPESLFNEAVEYVVSVEDRLEAGAVYFAEYLKKPKHNILSYSTHPKNHLSLFGMLSSGEWITKHDHLGLIAKDLGIDVVPLLFYGKINDIDEVFKLIDQESYLGGVSVEGVVVKNFKEYFIADRIIPVMAGKYVSEKFKEKHTKDWKKQNTGKGKWEVYVQQFRSEARWQKAVQHLKENGEIEGAPRDIGKLIKEIQRDIEEEERENIKEFLWRQFGREPMRVGTAGFPEWYKEKLARQEV